MALNYGTLKSQILEDSHRAGLTAKVDDFVRQAEGVIFRRLRCAEMLTRTTLTDSDRVEADRGIFALPSDYLEERAFYLLGNYPCKLESVSLDELRQLPGTYPVRNYTVLSDGEVEFRGVPGASDQVELVYYARPAAFSNDADTNDILTRHEVIYLASSLSVLYQYTQDLELSAAQAQIADAAIEALNEQASRMRSGARAAGPYNFSTLGAR